MKKLLTIREAMDYLNVSKITLQRWDNSGKLKAIRTAGGHRRYRSEDIEQFIKMNELKYTKVEDNDSYILDIADRILGCTEPSMDELDEEYYTLRCNAITLANYIQELHAK